MHKRLILPTNFVATTKVESPDEQSTGDRLYFLAGPIRGGGNWQGQAIHYLMDHDPDCYIACPKRYDESHMFHAYSLPNEESITQEPFPNQTLWERHYMTQAAIYGCLIFWLPEESKLDPRKEGGYGQDTRGEIGEWRIRRKYNLLDDKGTKAKVKLVIGAEPEFPGLSTIKKNEEAVHGSNSIIYRTLEETLNAAIALAKNNKPQLT